MRPLLSAAVLAVVLCPVVSAAGPPAAAPKKDPDVHSAVLVNRPFRTVEPTKKAAAPPAQAVPARPTASRPRTPAAPATSAPAAAGGDLLKIDPKDFIGRVSYVALFAAVSLAPAAVLMLTAFVRINIVLVILRQALGSPQVPGNQVLTALALLLTSLVMRPVGETVYARSIEPFARGKIGWAEAYDAASRPVKSFMMTQIRRTGHENYVWAVYDETASPGAADPVYDDDFPVGVVATSFLLSELTTALVIGFYLYLPFLVVDLVVSSVLAAMGLFMLPPSLVALPLKLILFVLADGWLQVATRLLQSFGPVAGSA